MAQLYQLCPRSVLATLEAVGSCSPQVQHSMGMILCVAPLKDSFRDFPIQKKTRNKTSLTLKNYITSLCYLCFHRLSWPDVQPSAQWLPPGGARGAGGPPNQRLPPGNRRTLWRRPPPNESCSSWSRGREAPPHSGRNGHCHVYSIFALPVSDRV